jgi:hypothetical protein
MKKLYSKVIQLTNLEQYFDDLLAGKEITIANEEEENE